MSGKTTSIKIDPETWRRAKLLAVKRGATLKSVIEEMLVSEILADEFVGEAAVEVSGYMNVLEERRKSGQMPFVIKSRRRAVDLVKEHRGR